ncbi:MAG TPA: phosphate ABC transporter substrate-binding protein [Armatimonadota bacterium]|nr:phosphate ABC transporter substrate-binding protein [Armatimonadota bacterium]
MIWRASVVTVVAALAACVLGCSRPERGSGSATGGGGLQVIGSDTMANVAQAWAAAYYEKTGTQVSVTGGGSGTGIAAMLNGTCDIANASRRMEGKEITLADEKGLDPQETVVALDGLAVVVHPENPVGELTVDELAAIFTGEITNWREVGGEDDVIVLLSREVNSGTHVYFKEHVLRKGDKDSQSEFAPGALLQPSSQAIADIAAQNPRVIGYYGMGYLSEDQKPIAVAENADGPFVLPAPENVLDGSYSISRPLLLITNGAPEGDVKGYIDFILGPEGQQIVKDLEFVQAPSSAAAQ